MGAGVWLDGYAKGGAWMCNNTTPVPANSAAARHSDRSTGSNATTAYYASPSLCLPIFPPSLCFPIHPSIHPFPSSSFVSFPLGLCFSLVASSLFNPPPPPFSFHLLSTRTPLSFTCVHVVRDCLVDASRRAFEGGGGEMFFGRMWTMRFFGKFERLEEGVIIAQSVECN